jgi:hypothetical protein
LELIPVKSSGKWGYINKKGEYLINPQFKDANFFHDGLAKVVSSEGKVGYISKDGKYQISATFKDGTFFSDGLAFVVSEDGYPTCIDKSGEIKFALKQAKRVSSFREGLAFIDVDNKFGFVDKTGKVVITPQFDFVMLFFEGFAAVKQDNKCGFIDKTGKIVINLQFDEVSFFSEKKAAFKNGKQWGFIDAKGSYIINPQFDDILLFSEGMAAIKSGKEWGYISKDGKIAINSQFNKVHPFSNGLAAIKQGKKYGFINKKGKIAINPQFDKVSMFFDDIAFVKIADKWGIISKKGQYLVNPQFDEIKEMYIIETEIIEEDLVIETDYYDATVFINKFFERSNGVFFDGFGLTSTLQDVIDNSTYGDYAKCPGNGRISHYESGEDVINYVQNSEVICKNKQRLTDDISIKDVTFHFDNRICTAVSSGYSTTKEYNFDEKISVISYSFNLIGGASGRENAIANEMKTYIENKFNVKFSRTKNIWDVGYDFASNGKMSFAIMTTKDVQDYNSKMNNHLEFFVAFENEAIQRRIESYYSMD